ncbi:DUF4153 domain-containing protein [Clostridium sp. MB40-C1]|uniref:DUF4153 domain-containing protein n=1 Tax=Clostridium sp. MB40-C1 TaxID=3070996 RepID=UPI0027DFA402|nr:DUF4153 domain-containing protein [Clostridium sp. MB40-C1]WMJ81836.1 DUF4153 domain-containing protein [Clostridium sp. MB40-C1]
MKLKSVATNSLKGIYNSLKRFPVTISCSSVLTIMLIFMSEKQNVLSNDIINNLRRINMTIALAIPLSLCIKLIIEKKDEFKKGFKGILYLLGGLSLIFYYVIFLKELNMVSITRYMGISIFLYISFMYILWLGKKDNYELYVIKVISGFFLTIIYSFVLFLGISAIIFSIDKLFYIHISGEFYYYMFLITTLVFALSLFLGKVPFKNNEFKVSNYPKAFKILILYIVIPLISIYTIILYAYFAKIIITMKWPIGLVSHLVLWYSLISVGVIFFISPIRSESTLARKFLLWFPKIILPLMAMMFCSIGIRIKAYGLTERRYFVVVLGLWLLGIMIYFSINNKKLKNIIIPISLSIIVLNSVIGPFSSYSLSKYSQNKRLEKILLRNNMLKDKKTIISNKNISQNDKIQISMILKYFKDNHSLENVKYLPSKFHINDMKDVLGFEFTSIGTDIGNDYIYYNSNSFQKPVKVNGYDYLFNIMSLNNETKVNDLIKITYNRDTFSFEVFYGGNKIYSERLDEYANLVYNKYKEQIGLDSVPSEDMTFMDENSKVKIKVIFNHIGGTKNISAETIIVKDMDFYILLKIK